MSLISPVFVSCHLSLPSYLSIVSSFPSSLTQAQEGRSPMTPRAINYLILIAALCDSADRI